MASALKACIMSKQKKNQKTATPKQPQQQSEKEPRDKNQTFQLLQRLRLNVKEAHAQHKQYLSHRPLDSTTYPKSQEQPTQLLLTFSQQVQTVVEAEEARKHSQKVIGSVQSFIINVGSPRSPFLIRVQLNCKTDKYMLSAVFLSPTQQPIRVRSSNARKRLCRFFNQHNSILIYGAYFVNPESGLVGFTIGPSQTKSRFQSILKDSKKFSDTVSEDLTILRMSLESFAPMVQKVYSEEKRESEFSKMFPWQSELLPVLDQSIEFNELEANKENLRQEDVIQRRIRQSQESFRSRIQELNPRMKLVEEVRECLDKHLPMLEHLTLPEISLLREKFKSSPNQGKAYRDILTKQKQSTNTENENINICTEIIPKQQIPDAEWKIFTTTANSEIRRQKLKFVYKYQTTGELILSQKQSPGKKNDCVTKLVSLKNPIIVRKDVEATPENNTIKRENEVLKMLARSQCYYIGRFYTLDPSFNVNLGKERRLNYGECVIMDYYTYQSADHFISTNCKTISSMSKLSILVQTATALLFTKNIHLTHCDLKPSNICIGKGIQAKLVDFGHSHLPVAKQVSQLTSIKPESMNGHVPGYTLPYSPPELFRRGELNFATQGHKFDVYSFGVMIMEMLFDNFPIERRPKNPGSQERLIQALQERTYMDLVLMNVERLYSYLSGDAAEILCYVALRCIDPDPQRRPCIDWVLVVMRGLQSYVERTCR